MSLDKRNGVSDLIVLLKFLDQALQSRVTSCLRIFVIFVNWLKLAKPVDSILYNFSFFRQSRSIRRGGATSSCYIFESRTKGVSEVIFESNFLLIVPVLVGLFLLWMVMMLWWVNLSQAQERNWSRSRKLHYVLYRLFEKWLSWLSVYYFELLFIKFWFEIGLLAQTE